jgi:fructan beta-fructosidase
MRFHACAPPGEWLNDPNALWFDGARFRLCVQHAADAPDYARIGWGGFASDDLLAWRWTGREIETDAAGRQAYSGSIARDAQGRIVVALTRNDAANQRQWQEWRRFGQAESERFGPEARDCRDPWILSARPGARAVLLARPCNWHDWPDAQPSRLEIWREDGAAGWRRTGIIGPWSPPGVVWEVPVLTRIDRRDVMLISQVDRREGGAKCSVRYWIGDFENDGFVAAPGFPDEGELLDHGPDFYAAIVNLAEGWPLAGPVLVGWASSWDYARQFASESGHGGAIALPRSLTCTPGRQRLAQRSVRGAPVESCWPLARGGHLRLAIGAARIELARPGAGLAVDIVRPPLPPHHSTAAFDYAGDASVAIMRDGPLAEIFIEPAGIAITALLPDASDGEATRKL